MTPPVTIAFGRRFQFGISLGCLWAMCLVLTTPATAATQWRSVPGPDGRVGVVAVADDGAALMLHCGAASPPPNERRVIARLAALSLEDEAEAVRVPTHYRVDGRAPVSARLVASAFDASDIGIAGPAYDLVSEEDDWLGVDLLELQVPSRRDRMRFDLASGRDRLAEIAAACGVAWPAADAEARQRRVENIQKALRAHGFDPSRADGVFDVATDGQILAYQQYHGLLIDGAPTDGLLAHLTSTRPTGLSQSGLEAVVAQIEPNWTVPSTAKGIYKMVLPLTLTVDAEGNITQAVAAAGLIESDRPMVRRLAYAAEDAARATRKLDGEALSAIAGVREFTINLRPPIAASYRKYARKLAQRIAFYANIPEHPDRDDALVVRLYIDGSAQSIKVEPVHGTGADSDSVRAVFRFIDTIPRIPPVPVEGTPKLFVMDLTLFQRDPFALAGWVAYPDWPLP